MMRIRVRADGPEAWRLVVENAETGEMLPVMANSLTTIEVEPRGVITISVKMIVSQLDFSGAAIPQIFKPGQIVEAERIVE